MSSAPSPLCDLPTSMPGLALRALTSADAEVYYALIDRNRDHLAEFGDYQDEKRATLEWVENHLAEGSGSIHYRYGIFLDCKIIGRVDLNPVAPPHYVLGYWLSRECFGHGYVTAACRTLINHGRTALAATMIFAGVTHGNHKSSHGGVPPPFRNENLLPVPVAATA
ncbi:GNAT family N-acetyltransferase, partial [Frankia sp. CNm7]